MKLRRRRKENEDENYSVRYSPLGRSQSHLYRSLLPPSFHSPPPPQPHHPASSAAQLPLRHVSGEQYSPAISSPAVPLLPSFFIKLPKQQSVAVVVPSQPTQLSYPTIACGAQLAAPLPLPVAACPPPFSLSPVSRCGPSTSSEAIGKQRPKTRFPVPSPSLTNK